ncbi:MAG TPA: DNA mismatch repair protein MutS, partial [Savagea sp.]
KEKEALILNADEQSLALEYERFVEVREQTKQYISEVQQMATQLSELDVYIALAIVAEQEQYVRPQFSKANELKIVEGRHPVVEKMMDRSLYVSNSCMLTQEENMYLITGPNMSGKSTYMRQIALTVLMAQVGSFVPCEEAVLPLTDRIFTRIGAADDVASGQSTFMMEMMESQVALSQATSKSLLLFDEIGRGTSTYDGMSLAQAMMEFIHDEIGANTLFSTHYHELTALEQQLPRLKNVHVDAKEQNGDVVFLHKVKEGSQDKSYGIHVAKLADLPPTIIARASELLEQFEKKKKEEPVEIKNADQVQEQLSFFEQIQPQEHHPKTTSAIEDEIRALDLYNMTPMEALNQLAIWKKQATKG